MERCLYCHWLIETADDVGARTPKGFPICLRCWTKDTEDERVMSATLRRDVQSVTNG